MGFSAVGMADIRDLTLALNRIMEGLVKGKLLDRDRAFTIHLTSTSNGRKFQAIVYNFIKETIEPETGSSIFWQDNAAFSVPRIMDPNDWFSAIFKLAETLLLLSPTTNHQRWYITVTRELGYEKGIKVNFFLREET